MPNILSFKVERDIFESKASASSVKLGSLVTLTTQLSVDRVPSLQRQCLSWGGVCSAAVYVEQQETPKDLLASLQDITDKVKQAGGCLVVSVIHKFQGNVNEYDTMYPINALRNLATEEAVGDFVFALDVDFIASKHMLDRFDDYSKHASQSEKPVALVIPAFWISPWVAGEDPNFFPRTPEELIDSQAELFKVSQREAAHGPTNFTKWNESMHMEKREYWTYDVKFAEYFEPYVIVNRLLAPRYDERFRGYGFNKAEFLHHLNALDFRFQVLATDGFVFHGEHAKSDSQEKYGNRLTDARAKDSDGTPLTQVGRVEALWASFRGELATNFPSQADLKKAFSEDTSQE